MIKYCIYYALEGIPFQRNFRNIDEAKKEYKMMLAQFNENTKLYNYIHLVEFKTLEYVSN